MNLRHVCYESSFARINEKLNIMSSSVAISQPPTAKQISTYIKKCFPEFDRRASFITGGKSFNLKNVAGQNILFGQRAAGETILCK